MLSPDPAESQQAAQQSDDDDDLLDWIVRDDHEIPTLGQLFLPGFGYKAAFYLLLTIIIWRITSNASIALTIGLAGLGLLISEYYLDGAKVLPQGILWWKVRPWRPFAQPQTILPHEIEAMLVYEKEKLFHAVILLSQNGSFELPRAWNWLPNARQFAETCARYYNCPIHYKVSAESEWPELRTARVALNWVAREPSDHGSTLQFEVVAENDLSGNTISKTLHGLYIPYFPFGERDAEIYFPNGRKWELIQERKNISVTRDREPAGEIVTVARTLSETIRVEWHQYGETKFSAVFCGKNNWNPATIAFFRKDALGAVLDGSGDNVSLVLGKFDLKILDPEVCTWVPLAMAAIRMRQIEKEAKNAGRSIAMAADLIFWPFMKLLFILRIPELIGALKRQSRRQKTRSS